MSDVRAIISEVASATLPRNVRNYKYRIMDGTVRHGQLMANEIMPEPTKGEIVAHQDGYYIQKAGRALFIAHLESLIGEELKVGDKVEIQHPGFDGMERGEEPSSTPGITAISLRRARLRCPVNNEYLKDLTNQLSEMQIEDGTGRRGLHLLHDLKFSNYCAVAPDESTNPYVEFEVAGAKFQGTVKIVYELGVDTYQVFFIKQAGQAEHFFDNVLFVDLLGILEESCDSSENRKVKVTFVSKRKNAAVAA